MYYAAKSRKVGDIYSLFGFASHLSHTQMRKIICSANRSNVVSAKTSQTIVRKLFTITKHFNSLFSIDILSVAQIGLNKWLKLETNHLIPMWLKHVSVLLLA